MKALVSGAGITGLAAAQRLAHHGWEVAVVEKAGGPRPQGYMMDFFGPGYEAVRLMGLEDRLVELGQRVRTADFVDRRGKVTSSMDYSVFEKAAGDGLVSIMRPDLELLLREAARSSADLRYGTVVERVDQRPDGITAELSDGTTAEADLLVVAEGLHSPTRALMFGPESDHLHRLGMHTSAFVFDDPELFAEVRGRFVMTDSVDAQLGMYGTREGRVAAFTVHRTDDPLPGDPRETLLARFGGMGPFTDRVMGRCPASEDLYYDEVAQIDMPSWTDGRAIVLGDAAYAVSLVAGQGASLGVSGAYVLGEILGSLSDSDGVPGALEAFESRFSPVVRDRQSTVRRNGAKVFLPHSEFQLRRRKWLTRLMRLPGTSRLLRSGLIGKDHTSVAALSEL
ncbi:FAD-dependent monooxygenase [Salininema proteolyticum]|uniref:FAD-dependent monooxygenase n=1 Tax=Salininema proteolyticum TaxID=1607685 RepID=A0ABV8U3T7_9ACTN